MNNAITPAERLRNQARFVDRRIEIYRKQIAGMEPGDDAATFEHLIADLLESKAALLLGATLVEGVAELEASLFTFLCGKYTQRSDARQRSMGLQYTEAETHDLAKELARFIVQGG